VTIFEKEAVHLFVKRLFFCVVVRVTQLYSISHIQFGITETFQSNVHHDKEV